MLYGILGVAMLYATVHFFVLDFKKSYKERTQYEKVVTIFAIVCISLVYFGVMFGE